MDIGCRPQKGNLSIGLDDIIELMKMDLLQKLGIKKRRGPSSRSGGTQDDRSEAKNEAKENKIPKEILDKLPPGVKIKQIVIGPQTIIRGVLYFLVGMWFLSALWSVVSPEDMKIGISEAVELVRANKVELAEVMGNQIFLTLKNNQGVLITSKEGNSSFIEILQRGGVDLANVNVRIENREGMKLVGDIVGTVLSLVLPMVLFFWLFRKVGGGMGGDGGVFGFGKSKAKLFIKGKQNIKFTDVAGVEEAKKDLMEVVDFLKNPKKYQKMGARTPKGVLLVGPAGVGKTLLAKAVAGEADVPFFSMAGSEFMEMLVGVGASRVRDLFGTAKKAGKAIIFIDEIDAIGRARGGLGNPSHGEREQTLNQILVEMDGFEANTTIVVLAATNRGDLLDPALLRPGRFDRRVVLEMPDIADRKGILAIHAKGKPFSKEVNWDRVAEATVGFSGADLENMLNEAAIKAAREDKKEIDRGDIEEASLKVKLGSEKRRVQTEDDIKMTAYHEAGHAIVNFVEGLDPVTRISVVSRGMALGFTLVPPKKDRIHETKTRLMSQMAMAMGGRAAEQLVFSNMTTGASSDIKHTTNIARSMVTEWGMSKLGPINLGTQFGGNEVDWMSMYQDPGQVSDGMKEKVDLEIKKLVDEAYRKALIILKRNRRKMDEVAKVLTEKETLLEEEFEKIMRE